MSVRHAYMPHDPTKARNCMLAQLKARARASRRLHGRPGGCTWSIRGPRRAQGCPCSSFCEDSILGLGSYNAQPRGWRDFSQLFHPVHDCCNFTQRTHVPRLEFFSGWSSVLGLSGEAVCGHSMGGLVSTAGASEAGVCPRAVSALNVSALARERTRPL